MRPDRSFPIPPPSRRLARAAWPLRWFLLRRALARLAVGLGIGRGPGRMSARALGHLDDRLLRDIGLRRETGPDGDRYRRL
jgi:hypothetical protein